MLPIPSFGQAVTYLSIEKRKSIGMRNGQTQFKGWGKIIISLFHHLGGGGGRGTPVMLPAPSPEPGPQSLIPCPFPRLVLGPFQGGTPVSGPMSRLGGTPVLSQVLPGGAPRTGVPPPPGLGYPLGKDWGTQSQDWGTTQPGLGYLPPGTGYTVGGMPHAVSHRRTLLDYQQYLIFRRNILHI